jgi:Ca-activated chloride channel family protein
MDKTTEGSMFEIALPWVFIVWPLPILIWFLTPRVAVQLPVALRVPFFSAVAGMLNDKKSVSAKWSSVALLLLVWTLLLVALSGPRFVGTPRPLAREGYNIMLALDLSGSMELDDMLLHGRPASRLAVVKRAAAQFISDRKQDKIGLILFGSRAYLQTPLTFDHRTLLSRIEDATVGLAGKTTSIGDALGLAVKRLQEVPSQGRVIILLTDGVNNSGVLAPLKAAELAATDGIKVYTIGLGVEQDPRLSQDLFLSLNATMELDEDTLKEVAKITGGRYFRATDMQSLQSIYSTINQMETVSQEKQIIRPQHEYYPWPLGVGLFLFGFWFYQQFGGALFKCLSFVRVEHAE